MAADFGTLVAQLREEGLGQRTNKQEKGLIKNAVYHGVLGFLLVQRTRYLPHSYCSQRFLQDRSISIFILGDSHILGLKWFLGTIFKYPLHYRC